MIIVELYYREPFEKQVVTCDDVPDGSYSWWPTGDRVLDHITIHAQVPEKREDPVSRVPSTPPPDRD